MTHHKPLLLAVTGLSPQVITETLYGLMMQGQPIPGEIRVITTLKGKERLVGSLLGPGQKLAAFCADYRLPLIQFDQSRIHVITNAHGEPIDDATSEEDHGAIADFMMNLVRELTNDNDRAIHASLAGGRKTMTFLLGYAMSLFGRRQDRLSHVLVSAPFEEIPDFYYPTPTDRVVMTRDHRSLNPRDAKVHLVDIPFVRMREEMPKQIVSGVRSYAETVAHINLALDGTTLPVSLDFERLEITIGDRCISPTTDAFTFYAMMAYRLVEQDGEARGLQRPPRDDFADHIAPEYLLAFFPPAQRQQLKGANLSLQRLLDEADDRADRIGCKPPLISQATRKELIRHGFAETLWNRIRRSLSDSLGCELGDRLKDHFDIGVLAKIKTGGKPQQIQGLKLEPAQIRMAP